LWKKQKKKFYKLKFFISATYVSGLHVEARLKVSVMIDCVCLEVLAFSPLSAKRMQMRSGEVVRWKCYGKWLQPVDTCDGYCLRETSAQRFIYRLHAHQIWNCWRESVQCKL